MLVKYVSNKFFNLLVFEYFEHSSVNSPIVILKFFFNNHVKKFINKMDINFFVKLNQIFVININWKVKKEEGGGGKDEN